MTEEPVITSGAILAGLGLLKALVVAMFGLNVGVILTWVERRMRGMIQDSVGPNRAAIPVPGFVAAGLAFGPAALLALAVLGLAFASPLREAESDHGFYGTLFTHGGVFVLWVTLASIARAVGTRGAENGLERAIAQLGAPRTIAIFGLWTHGLLIVVSSLLGGTGAEGFRNQALFGGGALLLAAAALAGAGHVASRLVREKTVRLTLLGLLHPAADGLKTAFKADFIPPKSDKFLYNIAPLISFFPAVVVLAVVPFGPALCFGEDAKGGILFSEFQGVEAPGNVCEAARFSLQVADLNVGILYFFAMAGTGIVGAALAGWASDNKFSLLGGMRAASQMVSYEVTLGLTVIGAIMVYGTVRIDEMVLWQASNAWGIFVQPLAFFLFMAAAIAETKRVPFDIPEGESEVVAGYFTEYAGMKFSLFFVSEFIAVVTSSTLIAALFFGGWHLPFLTAEGVRVQIGETLYFANEMSPVQVAVIGGLGFVGKVVSLCVLQVVIRWTLPRFRYDQLMRLGWRKLLPTSLVNIVITAVVILGFDSMSPELTEKLTVFGQLTMATVVLIGVGAILWLGAFLLKPRSKQLLVVSSAARFARTLGGTREAKMEA